MTKPLYANTFSPRFNSAARHPHAFSLLEILVVTAVFAILVGVSVAALSHAQQAGKRTQCAANLHSIALAFQNYATDNADRYPQPLQGAQWEDLLRIYVPRKTFCCPADQELFPATASSYDWRDTGDPATSLAGRRTPDTSRQTISLTYDALPGWHQPHKIQLALTDCSVQMENEDVFLREVQTPVLNNGP